MIEVQHIDCWWKRFGAKGTTAGDGVELLVEMYSEVDTKYQFCQNHSLYIACREEIWSSEWRTDIISPLGLIGTYCMGSAGYETAD